MTCDQSDTGIGMLSPVNSISLSADGGAMHYKTDKDYLREVEGEITRILIQYWYLLGKPPVSEFLATLPIASGIAFIEWEHRSQRPEEESIRLN
jgi:hypothetical protein